MWDIIEPNVTTIAACIPGLRILIRDVRDSSRRYPLSGAPSRTTETRSGAAQTWNAGRGVVSNKSRATTGVRSFQEADDESDRSILGAGAAPAKPGQITRTEEVSVEYRERRPGETGTYELRKFP